jgi:hypothetical protein
VARRPVGYLSCLASRILVGEESKLSSDKAKEHMFDEAMQHARSSKNQTWQQQCDEEGDGHDLEVAI